MKCLICGRKIITRGAKKYCSRKCYSVGKLGSVPWNKGMEYSPRMKIRLNMEGLKLGRKKGIKRPGLLINNPMYLEEVKCKVHNNPNVQKAYFKKKHIPKNWKGNDVGYSALHDWVKRKLGKADICSNCKSDKKVQWANKSHKYNRNVNDWIKLCYWCHRKYDRKNGWGRASKKFPELRRKYI